MAPKETAKLLQEIRNCELMYIIFSCYALLPAETCLQFLINKRKSNLNLLRFDFLLLRFDFVKLRVDLFF